MPHTDVLVSLSRYICFSKFCIHVYFDKVFDKKSTLTKPFLIQMIMQKIHKP